MANKIKKYIAILLLTVLTATCLSGCGEEAEKEAIKNGATAFLMAASGFNLSGMESCLLEGKNEDFGIETSMIERGYVQTETYKKQVESMFKALGATMTFTVDSVEKTGEETAIAKVTVKHADADGEAVREYTHKKVDDYIATHPAMVQKTEVEKNDICITVMADAFREFVQLQPKAEETLDINLVKTRDGWKIAPVTKNKALKKMLEGIFGTV